MMFCFSGNGDIRKGKGNWTELPELANGPFKSQSHSVLRSVSLMRKPRL